jgi:uncharacterized protein DUF3187
MYFCRRITAVFGIVAIYLWAVEVYAGEHVLNLRPQSPFIQIYGLPAFLNGELLPAGRRSLSVDAGVISHADHGSKDDERIILDGETLVLELRGTWTVGERWELHAALPYYEYSGGFLDAPIEQFHKIVGINNSERDGARGRMFVAYEGDGATGIAIDGSDGGVGDLRLGAAYRLWVGEDGDALSVHGGVKLATGDEDELTGSGATDVFAAVAWKNARLFGQEKATLQFHAGVISLGNGEVLPELQESTAVFGGVGLSWMYRPSITALVQLSGSSRLYDSGLAELGASIMQLGFGFNIHPPQSPWRASIAVVEDVWSDATPDFGLHFELHLEL